MRVRMSWKYVGAPPVVRIASEINFAMISLRVALVLSMRSMTSTAFSILLPGGAKRLPPLLFALLFAATFFTDFLLGDFFDFFVVGIFLTPVVVNV